MAEGNVLANAREEPVRFVLETDDAPEFWQFLNGLKGNDLLVELIVNELDARSPRTEVRFETERLICSGEGVPVDDDGWRRLALLRGAGRKAPAKKGLFGIKNHGLKACFTLGNDIFVRSAGKQVLQTLFADGPGQPAYPGVRRPPINDPEAPAAGTRIEVPYRRASFRAPDGEPFEFPARSDADIEAMFREAALALPKRLLGIIRPHMLERFDLRLVHHALGTVDLIFECSQWKEQRGLIVFTRSCHVTVPDGVDSAGVRERAILAAVPTGQEDDRAVFFRSTAYSNARGKPLFVSDGTVIEVAWTIGKSDKLLGGTGKLRYPVSYPGEGGGARSGFAFDYAAPFSSDAERHELGAQSTAWNDELVADCDKLAARALGEVLIPRYGAEALRLVCEGPEPDRFANLISALLKARALPAVDRIGAAMEVKKGTVLVVPAYTWNTGVWSKELARASPDGAPILDPRSPAAVVAILGEQKLASWRDDHFRFDEDDVLDRMTRPSAKYFPWPSEKAWRRTLGDSRRAAEHLDALVPHLSRCKPEDRPATAAIHLPDADGKLHPFGNLKRGVSLPGGLLDVALPPVLHPGIRDHAIFRLKGWTPGTFTFADLLSSGDIAELSIAARRRFLAWLTHNHQYVGRDDWSPLKALPIWTATNGDAVPLDRLCRPKDPKLAAWLGNKLLRPTRDVLALCKAADSRRVRVKVRAEPNADEVAATYRDHITTFDTDGPLPPAERARFHALEAQVAAFSRDGRIAIAFKQLEDIAVALDATGRLRPVGELVRPSLDVDRLALRPEMLIDRPAADLDVIFPPLQRPTWRIVADALRADPSNSGAHIARFRALVSATTDPDAYFRRS
ncbi:MAG: hypothetical protein E5Y79_09440 [Mesorhizobium sp.]|uniref:hypothetical protein n=1 Tax=Mesorhizobium sp. TaxID=1871066 RepID=UPI00121F16AC|nr:hypothetical protein [Mesorhizobium sp.]TIL60497.1 MAG: hypothetical protein E5Y79_09440 [Mesorhizobium sp.]